MTAVSIKLGAINMKRSFHHSADDKLFNFIRSRSHFGSSVLIQDGYMGAVWWALTCIFARSLRLSGVNATTASPNGTSWPQKAMSIPFSGLSFLLQRLLPLILQIWALGVEFFLNQSVILSLTNLYMVFPLWNTSTRRAVQKPFPMMCIFHKCILNKLGWLLLFHFCAHPRGLRCHGRRDL